MHKKVNFEAFFDDLWAICTKNDVISIIVEGGTFTLNQFIENDLWDEARVLTGKPFFVEGVKAPKLNNEPFQQLSFGEDIITYYTK